MIRFSGRGFPSAIVAITADTTSVRIRADDEQNPEAWVEILIPFEELLRLERLVHRAKLHAACDARGVARINLEDIDDDETPIERDQQQPPQEDK